MDKSLHTGDNRTGTATSKDMAKQMREAAQSMKMTSTLDAEEARQTRESYIRESDPVGSMPKGVHAQVLINKIGERMAFERTGVRLYEALLTKCEMEQNDLPLDDIHRFQKEEFKHFQMLKKCMESLGADPTAVTPGANIAAVTSEGILKVMTDPRTNLAQTLEALLMAELADNDGWTLLIAMARDAGEDELVEKFEEARKEENQHLEGIREMVEKLNSSEQSLLH